ncbi:uncharacterized protein LOC124614214 [Schistocerca americana]|uniref:uncharacterized protein LOC124614214 n=1 Tax=Schistocerca americana TaxID=7009 RepID=UPI001F4F5460|nr:uncharacterized protein LOC124614214 [Schistocerca americana]XP_047099095.1 uncharacterized protein LOC124716022 [Schistocerca piceifrons]XP_049807370.1 uncharacterized protein LOC126249732 [Schistocerca nitens]XP_049831542.1 uncharacterized protein LOC126272623 [Schistocerca gregaria]XP_049937324.1 uncharacterized protein LOC126411498 [Schistocerca serialis cubense]
MDSAFKRDKDNKKTVVSKFELFKKPINTHNVLFYYVPFYGAASYSALSVNVLNPGLGVRMFPKRDVTNILLLSTLIGTGLYIYDRKHMRAAPKIPKVGYSVFGALMFSFGSVLMWAVMRSILPENSIIATTCGISSALGLVKAGTNYLEFVDSQVKN